MRPTVTIKGKISRRRRTIKFTINVSARSRKGFIEKVLPYVSIPRKKGSSLRPRA